VIPFLTKHIIFPMYERLRCRDTIKYLKELEESQWFSPKQLKELQFYKLKRLLHHAYHNSPYYNNLFNKLGISPEQIRNFEDFTRIPPLSRDDLRENLENIVVKGKQRGIIKASTGGSTGEPVFFYMDRRRAAYDIAAKIRARRWWGIDIGDKEVILWGSPIELTRQTRIVKLKDRLLNCILLSAFDMSEETMSEYYKLLLNFKPKVLSGYASSLYCFAQFLEYENLNAKDIGIKLVISTAELLYDFMREKISSVFGCPIANEYGARDGGFIAHECPHGNMHLTAENIYVEIYSGDRPAQSGETGEVYLTHLDNYATPLIRYKIGDLLTRIDEGCPCGRGLPLVKVDAGRTHDIIITDSGKLIHPLFFIYIIRDLPGIKQFKVIQRTTRDILIQMIITDDFDKDNVGLIRNKIQERMGNQTRVEIAFVDEIQPESSGKHRWIVSEIPGKKLGEYKFEGVEV